MLQQHSYSRRHRPRNVTPVAIDHTVFIDVGRNDHPLLCTVRVFKNRNQAFSINVRILRQTTKSNECFVGIYKPNSKVGFNTLWYTRSRPDEGHIGGTFPERMLFKRREKNPFVLAIVVSAFLVPCLIFISFSGCSTLPGEGSFGDFLS